MTSEEFDAIWKSMTEEQKENARAKAKWEHMTLWAVLIDWPDLCKEAERDADREALRMEV